MRPRNCGCIIGQPSPSMTRGPWWWFCWHRDRSHRCRPPSSTARTRPPDRACNGSGARPVLATRSSTWFFSSTSDVWYLPCRDERSCAPVRPDATAAATTEPTEGSHDGSRGRGDIGFPAAVGNFGCRQISVRRAEPKPRTPEDVGRFVLEILAAWLPRAPSEHVSTMKLTATAPGVSRGQPRRPFFAEDRVLSPRRSRRSSSRSSGREAIQALPGIAVGLAQPVPDGPGGRLELRGCGLCVPCPRIVLRSSASRATAGLMPCLSSLGRWPAAPP
jgi:hypothetical protein